jgi:hypothetical protein
MSVTHFAKFAIVNKYLSQVDWPTTEGGNHEMISVYGKARVCIEWAINYMNLAFNKQRQNAKSSDEACHALKDSQWIRMPKAHSIKTESKSLWSEKVKSRKINVESNTHAQEINASQLLI